MKPVVASWMRCRHEEQDNNKTTIQHGDYPMNLLASLAQEVLSENGYRCVRKEDDGSLHSQIRLNGGLYGLVLETDSDPQQVTVFLYLPEIVPAAKRFAIMEYFTRINNELPMGHFEIDLDDGRTRFVSGQLLENNNLPAKLLLVLMRNALDRVETFFPGLMRILHGGLHAAAALAEIEERHGYAGRHVGRYVSQRLN